MDGLLGAQGSGILGANVAVEESSARDAFYVVVLAAMTGMLLLAWDWDLDEPLKEQVLRVLWVLNRLQMVERWTGVTVGLIPERYPGLELLEEGATR
jgi:hypothetical protein